MNNARSSWSGKAGETGRRGIFCEFPDGGDVLATADAHRCQTVARLDALHFVQQLGDGDDRLYR